MEFIVLFLPIVVLGFFARVSCSSALAAAREDQIAATDRLMAALK
jgi:hypothetical protein